MSVHDLSERLAAVVAERDRARSEDRDVAVAARAALVRMVTDDSPEVAAAAQQAVTETSISLDPPRIDFGPVAPGTPRLSAAITIQGPPMALASQIKVTGAGLRARIAGEQLQVQWQPGAGALSGMVSLDGPAGAADLPVTGHIGPGRLGNDPIGTWPEENASSGTRPDAGAPRGDWPMIAVTAVDREPVFPLPSDPPPRTRRRGKGPIIAGATALVLLVGTGLAAAVTLQDEPRPPARPEQAAPPASSGPTGAARPGQGQDRDGGDPARGTVPRPSLGKPAVVGTIEVGDEPEGVAVSPDSRTLYVANQSSRVLSVADLQSGEVRSVTLRNTPRFVAVSPDGRRVFVSMYEDDLSGSGVAVVDARRLTVVRNLRTGVQPYALAVAPDGRLWVPIHGGRNVEIYESERLTGRVFVPQNPHAVSFDADGQRAFTPDHESSTVSVIDPRTDRRLKSIPVSAAPHSLAVSPDGRTVVVACFEAGAVDLIDTATLERRGPFKVGRKPQAAAFATDSGHAYAVNEGSNSVSVVDPRTGQVTATVPVGRSPRTMAVAPNGRFAYVSNGDDDTVTILRVS